MCIARPPDGAAKGCSRCCQWVLLSPAAATVLSSEPCLDGVLGRLQLRQPRLDAPPRLRA